MAIAIDKGIPLPDRAQAHRGPASKYPWRTMEVGDSFAVPPEVVVKHFRRGVGQAQLVTGRRFSVRACNGGYRCWRTA